MRLAALIILATAASSLAESDLTCLFWELVALPAGLICHFAPAFASKFEDEAVQKVSSAITAGKDLIKWDVKHAPVTVAFEYAAKAATEGIGSANQYAGSVGLDYLNVTIGFAEESANQAYNIYNLLDWSDVTQCEIDGALQIVRQQSRRRSLIKRAPIGLDQGVSLVEQCIMNKFQKPAIFNISDPNQKMGATISDIAGLFVPIPARAGTGAAAAEEIAKDALDLVVPGSEETARILKSVNGGESSAHFANSGEAESVLENLKNKDWVNSHCRVSKQSSTPGVGGVVRRGFGVGTPVNDMWCEIGTSFGATVITDDSKNIYAEQRPEGADPGPSAKDTSITPANEPAWGAVPEDQLVKPPDLTAKSLDDIGGILKDIDETSTTLISWSDQTKGLFSSDVLLAKLRKVFENPNDPLYKKLKVNRPDQTRYNMPLHDLDTQDPDLREFRDFAVSVYQELDDVAVKLNGNSREELEKNSRIFLDVFCTPPGFPARDAVPFHTDDAIVALDVMDTEGLLIGNSRLHKASRVPVKTNAWYLIKGETWKKNVYNGYEIGPTSHHVYGKEIVEKGRMSMIAWMKEGLEDPPAGEDE